jgi:hypothetical protein
MRLHSACAERRQGQLTVRTSWSSAGRSGGEHDASASDPQPCQNVRAVGPANLD